VLATFAFAKFVRGTSKLGHVP